MFSKIKAFFTTVEQTVEHDVEAIISTFTTTIEKLEAAAAAKVAEATILYNKSSELTYAADVAHKASEKATAVAAKIKALVA
ncbi:hypothetical protein [Bradyrhizobium sp. USDA 4350]